MAVLFADVSDSTRLYESIGDTAAFGNVREVIGLLKGITEAFSGRVVKTIGDGLMCAFPDADGAASAAGEMQRQIAQRPPMKNGKQLTIRVGFHLRPGDPGRRGRVRRQRERRRAHGGARARRPGDHGRRYRGGAVSSQMRDTMRRINALPVKGKAEEVEVYELLWQASSDRTVIPGRTVAPASAPARRGPASGSSIEARSSSFKDTVYFGREAAGNHVVVMDPMASRRHAKIELRGGKFVLVDQSSNGTFVTLGSNAEMRLKREEVILYGSGVIAFGHSAAEGGARWSSFTAIQIDRQAGQDNY